jgi:hypothetical protein
MTTIMHNAPPSWTLDEAINHELYIKDLAKSMAAMPSVEAVKMAEQFYMNELFFQPIKALRPNERSWKITLPTQSGRKTRWGVTLILSEKSDDGSKKPPMPEYGRVSLYAHTTRLRRLVHPRHITWYGRVPFLGTLYVQLFKKEASLAWFPSGLSDLEKYTKSC